MNPRQITPGAADGVKVKRLAIGHEIYPVQLIAYKFSCFGHGTTGDVGQQQMPERQGDALAYFAIVYLHQFK